MASQAGSPSCGAARPRLELRPPGIVDTVGWAPAELMVRAGKPLDPWQRDAMDLMCSVREDGTWACSDYAEWVARQNGKGGLLEARALGGLLLFGEDCVMWSSHEVKTALEGFRRTKILLNRLGFLPNPRNANLIEIPLDDTGATCLVKVNNTNGQESFERLDTGQRILFIARTKGSGRGFTSGAKLIDEAFAYTLAQQDAQAPTSLATQDDQDVYMSTPPLDGMTGEVMYALRARADAGGDDSLGYRDWGLGGWLEELENWANTGRPLDVDDRDLWAQTNPALGRRIRQERLVKLRRKMGRTGFARESLCIWPKQALQIKNRVIDLQLWADRGDPDSRPATGGALVFAIDVSPNGRTAAIASGGRRADERLHTKIVDYRPGAGWVVARAVELQRRYGPIAWLLDPNGPAGALLGDLQAAGIDPLLVTGRELAQACGALVNDMVEDRWRHCDQAALNTSAEQATARAVGDAWVWHRRDPSADVCPLFAVTLAAHGFRVHSGKEPLTPMAAWV